MARAVVAGVLFWFTVHACRAEDGRGSATAEAYVAMAGGTLIAAGQTEIDGRPMRCGAAATVLDPSFSDFGGAMPGFIVLNPRLFDGLATPVKLWIYSHECAHETVGPNEVRADCVAVERGKREGWLTAAGLAQVCEFMKPARADTTHFSGPQRCELMQRCLAGAASSGGAARERAHRPR